MMDKKQFVMNLYYMNKEEREAIGMVGYSGPDEYYSYNAPFINELWKQYEETGKYPFRTQDGE